MKLSKVIAIGSGLVAFLFMKLVVFGEPSSPSRVTFAQIEQEMMTPPSDEMFKAIKAAFPEEYRQHLETLATIANTREVDTQTLRTRAFTEGKSFTINLRRENSEHVRNAPVEDLRNLLSASYNMINSVSDDKRLCAEIAANGLTNFTQSDVQKFDMSLVIESATVTFHAIAAGRETPHIREIPVGYDWGEFTKNWVATGEVTNDDTERFYQGNVSDQAVYCDTALSFLKHLKSVETQSGLRVAAEVATRAAAN